jgi:dipeptidyl aminopeptidase/acylaminoacyl peptidase
MNERRLRALLEEVPVPEAAEAERRGLLVASAAFEERDPRSRLRLPRLAVAIAAVTLLAAVALTPAGAAVRDWIDDVFTAGVPNPEPALTKVPSGGRLLVGNPQGAWVVQPDGSRRLLGRYADATWSPRGLFVAAAEGRTLSAIEPSGAVHWVLSAAAPVSDPRWSPSGTRIAYRADRSLRVVVGDGTEDRLLAGAVAPVAPAWSPLGPHLLAYIDAGHRLRIVNTDSHERLASSALPPDVEAVAWSPDGALMLAVSPQSLQVRSIATAKLANRLTLGDVHLLPLPGGATVRAAAFAPSGNTFAVLLERPGRGALPPRSTLVLIDPVRETYRPLYNASGRLAELAWSPDGSRLLIGWPEADQWLFIPTEGRRRVRAIAPISREFAPGSTGAAAFPSIDGWCCSAQVGAPGSP